VCKGKFAVAVIAAVMLASACGDSGTTLGSPDDTATSSTATSPSVTTSSAVTTTTPQATTTAPVTTSTLAATTTAPEVLGPDAYRPAEFDPPLGEQSADLLVFDAQAVYWLVDGKFTKITEGPFAEVVDDGAGGILFQREVRDSRVIWWLPSDATDPQELLVVEEPTSLVLEGLIGEGEDREVVYQRRVWAGPIDSIDTLNTYRLADAVTRELDATGGWENLTQIDSVVDGVAVGVWTGEASAAYYRFELASGNRVEPFGESDERPWGDRVSIHKDQLLSVGELATQGGEYLGLGLSRIDSNSKKSEPIASYLADEIDWYPSALLVVDNYALISRGPDSDGRAASPLGPIVVDLQTGASFTLPFAANVRPMTSGARP
jgi:hypothetical protein